MNLGRYEVISELGKGAMGVVYLARDTIIGRMVALKTLRTSILDDEEDGDEFRQRFTREAQAAGILNHPSIVQIYDIGTDTSTGVSFIAMEFVEGKNLKQLAREGVSFTPEKIADVIAQIADGLDYAHSKGIVHRDVKPANIMLTAEGRAKITDFGIAKVQSSSLTSTGQFLGTPNYMSPEQISGMPIDSRSDLFALGIVLYEMLTKKKPFPGENLTETSYKIVHASFPSPSEICENFPAPFEPVVVRALAKDPAGRFQTGREFGAELRRVAQEPRRTAAAEARSKEETPPEAAPNETVFARQSGPVPLPQVEPSAPAPASPADTTPALLIPVAPEEGGRASLPGEDAPTIQPKPFSPELPAASVSPPLQTSAGSPPFPAWQKPAILAGGAALLLVAAIFVPRLFVRHSSDGAVRTGSAAVASSRSAPAPEPVSVPMPVASGADPAARRTEEAGKHLGEAKRALEGGRYSLAIRESQSVLAIDRENAEAKAYLASAKEKLAAKPPAAAKAAPGSAVERGKVESAGMSTLTIRFRSAVVGKGFLLVYAGGKQVIRHQVDWSRKISFWTSEETGGSFEKSVEVSSGEVPVRVQFVNPERGIDLLESQNGRFPAGKGRTLSIDLDASGKKWSLGWS